MPIDALLFYFDFGVIPGDTRVTQKLCPAGSGNHVGCQGLDLSWSVPWIAQDLVLFYFLICFGFGATSDAPRLLLEHKYRVQSVS